jgi:hypothetical protein
MSLDILCNLQQIHHLRWKKIPLVLLQYSMLYTTSQSITCLYRYALYFLIWLFTTILKVALNLSYKILDVFMFLCLLPLFHSNPSNKVGVPEHGFLLCLKSKKWSFIRRENVRWHLILAYFPVKHSVNFHSRKRGSNRFNSHTICRFPLTQRWKTHNQSSAGRKKINRHMAHQNVWL